MNRHHRKLQKRYIVYCEGDTEYNYIEKMRKNQEVRIALKPINMHGGGYANFLKQVKKDPNSNCIAKFIIVDADRIHKHAGERENFQKLVDYCRVQNKKGVVPHFLIVNNPDFEYIACLHIPEYKGQDVTRFFQGFGYKSLEQFKSDGNIYEFLNSENRSYKVMLSKIQDKEKLVQNNYSIKKKSFDIIITKTNIDWNFIDNKNSNIEEFFDVIEW